MSRGAAAPAGRGAAEAAAPAADRLAGVLLASLDELAPPGRAEAAGRLAGQAYAALRKSDLKAARRFDALLHRLAGRLAW